MSWFTLYWWEQEDFLYFSSHSWSALWALSDVSSWPKLSRGCVLRLDVAVSEKHIASRMSFHFSLVIVTCKNIFHLVLSFELFQSTYGMSVELVIFLCFDYVEIIYLILSNICCGSVFMDIIRFIGYENCSFIVFESLHLYLYLLDLSFQTSVFLFSW